MQSISEVTL